MDCADRKNTTAPAGKQATCEPWQTENPKTKAVSACHENGDRDTQTRAAAAPSGRELEPGSSRAWIPSISFNPLGRACPSLDSCRREPGILRVGGGRVGGIQ